MLKFLLSRKPNWKFLEGADWYHRRHCLVVLFPTCSNSESSGKSQDSQSPAPLGILSLLVVGTSG